MPSSPPGGGPPWPRSTHGLQAGVDGLDEAGRPLVVGEEVARSRHDPAQHRVRTHEALDQGARLLVRWRVGRADRRQPRLELLGHADPEVEAERRRDLLREQTAGGAARDPAYDL